MTFGKVWRMKIHLKQIPAQGLHLDGDEGLPDPRP